MVGTGRSAKATLFSPCRMKERFWGGWDVSRSGMGSGGSVRTFALGVAAPFVVGASPFVVGVCVSVAMSRRRNRPATVLWGFVLS